MRYSLLWRCSVLVPPKNCSLTIKSYPDQTLQSMDQALNKSGLWPKINTSFNVTCLAPSTEAFKNAGNPQLSGTQNEVAGTVLYVTSSPVLSFLIHQLTVSERHHTLEQVTYTNFLEDGMVLNSLNNTKITVRIKGNDIYFNNAKVIEANVLTNNGVVHM